MVDVQNAGSTAGGHSLEGAAVEGTEAQEDIEIVIARLKAMMAAAEEAEAGAGQAPTDADDGPAPSANPRDTDGSEHAAEAEPAYQAAEAPQPEAGHGTHTSLMAALAAPLTPEIADDGPAFAAPLIEPVAPVTQPIKEDVPAAAPNPALSRDSSVPHAEPLESVLDTTAAPDHFDFG